jgi:uncharacterized protein DUF4383
MTTVQRVARLFGLVLMALALAGFVTRLGMAMDPDPGARALLIFPVNFLHNLLHLVLGLWGLASSRSYARARSYCLITGTIYLALGLLGFLGPTLLGLMPIAGHDRWLHAIFAIVLLGAGAGAVNSMSAQADL